ncbi:hypothetical protein ACFODZ_09520 [Marinicella sediminis]|uniref:Uncharacterized protein n=2 Tax=Marinicella sediminis TaxID=1792834 RepID=A0ABV7J8N1_9GAMM
MAEFAVETSIPERSSDFLAFTRSVCMHLAHQQPGDVRELLEQHLITDEAFTVLDALNQQIETLNERISINRFVIWSEHLPDNPDLTPPDKSPAVAMKVVK